LLDEEDVLVLFGLEGAAVAVLDRAFAHAVRQALEPREVVGRQRLARPVERLARGVVVVVVVHAPGDGGVVIAQEREARARAHVVAALVGLRAVADGVAEADPALGAELDGAPHDRLERGAVRVDVGEDGRPQDARARRLKGRLSYTPLASGG